MAISSNFKALASVLTLGIAALATQPVNAQTSFPTTPVVTTPVVTTPVVSTPVVSTPVVGSPIVRSSSSSSCSSSSCYGQFQQDILQGNVQSITQSVRDQLHTRLTTPGQTGRPIPFTGEGSGFDSRDPFLANGDKNPFAAMAYSKVYTKAPPPVVSQWLYGANLIGSVDQSYSFGTQINVGTVTGAFDVTKIGIFSATDALTFIGTGSGSWAHSFTGPFAQWNSTTPSASGTIAYLNGGFSADFGVLASWTGYSAPILVVAPTDNSVASYTANAQYRFDFPYSVWIEPTAGVTYSDVYTSNFGTKVANYTEVHAGGRIGTEMKWMGYTVQPLLSGAVFQVHDLNITNAVLAAGIIPAAPNLGLGGRGSAKITVLWTPNFSSYIEGHTSGVAGVKTPIAALQTTGAQAGLRYTW